MLGPAEPLQQPVNTEQLCKEAVGKYQADVRAEKLRGLKPSVDFVTIDCHRNERLV